MAETPLQRENMIPAVWVMTTGPFNAFRPEGYGAFLTPDQQARLERIRQGRMLFDGKHREYFLDEHRTQFDFPLVRVGRRELQMYVRNNVLRLISFKGADLLFGAEPMLRVEDEFQQQALSDLVERSQLHQLFYAKAVDASYEAEAFLESCIQDGAAYLREIPADEIFPMGKLRPDGQYAAYEQYSLANVGTATAAIWLVLTTRYEAGRIVRTLRQIDDKGQTVVADLDLKQWPLDEGQAPLEPVTTTGVPLNTITWIPNQLLRGVAVSDYDGAVDLQDELNAKQTQIGRVLAKHSDPKLGVPQSAADEQGNIRSDHDVFFYRSKEEIPSYLTWQAELASAMEDRDFTRDALLMQTEMSGILLGIKGSGNAEAFRTVRVQAYNSITKAARKAVYWKAGIRRAVTVTQMLEKTNARGFAYGQDALGLDLRDGIPVDELDQANKQAILATAQRQSLEGALEERLVDPAAVAKELARIRDDQAQQAATIELMNPPPMPVDENAPPQAGNDQGRAAA